MTLWNWLGFGKKSKDTTGVAVNTANNSMGSAKSLHNVPAGIPQTATAVAGKDPLTLFRALIEEKNQKQEILQAFRSLNIAFSSFIEKDALTYSEGIIDEDGEPAYTVSVEHSEIKTIKESFIALSIRCDVKQAISDKEYGIGVEIISIITPNTFTQNSSTISKIKELIQGKEPQIVSLLKQNFYAIADLVRHNGEEYENFVSKIKFTHHIRFKFNI